MASGFQRVHGHLLVQGRRRADADNVHLIQARAVIRHSLCLRQAISFDEPLRAGEIAIRQYGDDRILRKLEIAFDMGGRYAAAADNHHMKHRLLLSFLQP